jgi:hypothetical protein
MRHLAGDPAAGRLYADDMALGRVFVVDLASQRIRWLADTDKMPNTIDLSRELGGRRVSRMLRRLRPWADHDTDPGGTAMRANEITEILDRPISRELLARDLTRLAYVAKDGTPRNVPIAFTWNGSEIVMCTTKNAPKLPALRENPMVALTIDTEVHPPKILLIRGRAELDVVDGIPDEYLQINGSYEMTPEQRVEWEAEVRSLYDGMRAERERA